MGCVVAPDVIFAAKQSLTWGPIGGAANAAKQCNAAMPPTV